MKSTLSLTVLLLLTGCTSRAITNIERTVTESRPNNRPLRFKKQIVRESKFRKAFFETLKAKYQIDVESRQDTLILVEYFDNICVNCNFSAVSILVGDTAYEIERVDYNTQFVRDSVKVSKVNYKTRGHLIGDGLWKLLSNKTQPNPFNPKLYSSHCLDGANANITWILPKLVCYSVHVNCIW
ncbi:hypothetical protein [Spirosoma oryzae]|nr:hypothetical protein [Spirosoma oryzae]